MLRATADLNSGYLIGLDFKCKAGWEEEEMEGNPNLHLVNYVFVYFTPSRKTPTRVTRCGANGIYVHMKKYVHTKNT